MPLFLQRLWRLVSGRRAVAHPTHPSRDIHPAWVVVLASAWLATACNVPLWREVAALPGQGTLRGWGFALAFAVIVAAGNAALLSVLAWRWTLKPAITVLLLMAAFGAYFMLAYGIAIDASMLVNVMQTDVKEAGDLLNWRMLATVLALTAPPLLWLYRRPVRRMHVFRHMAHNGMLLVGAIVVIVVCLLLVFQDFASVMRNHTKLRYLINPLNSVYALGNIATKPLRLDTSTLMPLGRDAQLGASYAGQQKPPLLVLVLGETGRSVNFGLNGYERPTTPLLSARTDLATARNAWSCGTSTAASLPCMFSHLGKSGFESRKNNYENLLDVLKRAGFDVLWMDNQSGCKGVCDRIPSYSTASLKNPLYCQGGECLDNVMLEELPAQLQRLQGKGTDRPTVVVLHQMGSHGPAYYRRSDAQTKPFADECASNAFDKCQTEQIVNAYDNSIAYTDQFLARTIQWLQGRAATGQPTAMMYISDHGESLGEDGLYLHGMPYLIAPEVQKKVPWITWLSPEFLQNRGIRMDCLQQQKDRAITHDYLFHSVLGMLGVKTAVYRSDQDLFAACRR